MSQPTDGEDSAFPLEVDDEGLHARQWGLTKRELFAALILAGIASQAVFRDEEAPFARKAVAYADKLIAALHESTP